MITLKLIKDHQSAMRPLCWIWANHRCIVFYCGGSMMEPHPTVHQHYQHAERDVQWTGDLKTSRSSLAISCSSNLNSLYFWLRGYCTQKLGTMELTLTLKICEAVEEIWANTPAADMVWKSVDLLAARTRKYNPIASGGHIQCSISIGITNKLCIPLKMTLFNL